MSTHAISISLAINHKPQTSRLSIKLCVIRINNFHTAEYLFYYMCSLSPYYGESFCLLITSGIDEVRPSLLFRNIQQERDYRTTIRKVTHCNHVIFTIFM